MTLKDLYLVIDKSKCFVVDDTNPCESNCLAYTDPKTNQTTFMAEHNKFHDVAFSDKYIVEKILMLDDCIGIIVKEVA